MMNEIKRPPGFKIRKLTVCMVIISMVLSTGFSLAQETNIDMNALTQETQKRFNSNQEIVFLWWVPNEYWKASLSKNPNMTPAQVDAFLKIFSEYILIIAVDGNIGPIGGVTYTSEEDMRNIIQVIDDQGNRYGPLDDEKINADVKNLLLMIKPVFANLLGPLGENLHTFLFSSKTNKGQVMAAASEEGSLTVELDNRKFTWKLPLGALMPKIICPAGGETLNGNWKYCPWHGVKLK